MDKNSKIYISGHTGMVGQATLKSLKTAGYVNLILKTEIELDLSNQESVNRFFDKERPEYVFHFAAKVGGIMANISFPVEFLYENLMITSNLIHTAYKYKVKKLLNLGSSCIYPRDCPQPMKEKYLLTGKLEPTNEGYALAKIAGLKLCEYYNKEYKTNFISLMPPNIYGPGDHFGVESSHVISALIYKFHRAKIDNKSKVALWGTGNARREFLYVEAAADACLFFMENYEAKDLTPFINVGVGNDISIKELAYMIKEIIEFEGEIFFDIKKPDGMPKKLLDSSQTKRLGWASKVSLKEGIKNTYKWYLANEQKRD